MTQSLCHEKFLSKALEGFRNFKQGYNFCRRNAKLAVSFKTPSAGEDATERVNLNIKLALGASFF
jgi:hypothetical protein